MRNNRDVIHYGQIPTKLKTIKTEIFDQGHKAIYALLKCLVSEPNSFQQKNQIIVAASLFERISCLVYFGKEGYYQKPSVDKYYKDIFEGFAETPEEVYDRIKRFGVTEEKANHIFKLVWQSTALLEQIRTIDKCRLIKYVGETTEEEMNEITEALRVSVDV